ncbi:hypothetical protein [Emticicia sp. C21]|uniref:hypothetical protein n=1 Tax=Emticicia sp. C21 TaxID=2302915 RepID=UPI000E86F1F1|nr:hypothetical protein [Emticicia sp. C21]RFS14944.1 hypothetical protein D0T08_17815 [Emticicia sp. C21]
MNNIFYRLADFDINILNGKTFVLQCVLMLLILYIGIKYFSDIRAHIENNHKVKFLINLSGFLTFLVTLFFGIHADIISQYDRYKIQKNNWFNFATIYSYPFKQAVIQENNEFYTNKIYAINDTASKSIVSKKRSYIFIVDKSLSTSENKLYDKYIKQLKEQLKTDSKSMRPDFDEFTASLKLQDLILMSYISYLHQQNIDAYIDCIIYYGREKEPIKENIEYLSAPRKMPLPSPDAFINFQDNLKNKLSKATNKNHNSNYSKIMELCKESHDRIKTHGKSEYNSCVLTLIGDFDHDIDSAYSFLELNKAISELPSEIHHTNLIVVPTHNLSNEKINERVGQTLDLFKSKYFQYSYLYSIDAKNTWLSTSPIDVVKSVMAIPDTSLMEEGKNQEIFLYKSYRGNNAFDMYKGKLIFKDMKGYATLHFTGKSENSKLCILLNNKQQLFLNVPQRVNISEPLEITLNSDFSNVNDFYLELIPENPLYRYKIPINLSNKLPNSSVWFLSLCMTLLYSSIFFIAFGTAKRIKSEVKGFDAFVVMCIRVLSCTLFGYYVLFLQIGYLFESHYRQLLLLVVLQGALGYFAMVKRIKIWQKYPSTSDCKFVEITKTAPS